MQQTGSKQDAGFSLIEVMIVIAILALAAGLTVSGVSNVRTQLRMGSGFSDVQKLLLDARRAANASGQTVDVDILVNERRISIPRLQKTVTLPAEFKVHFSGGSRHIVDSRGARISFFGDGSSTGGLLSISHQASRAGYRVSWLTGVVDKSDLP